jgi:leucyl/phenylalanyl-tRNA--protein transferase
MVADNGGPLDSRGCGQDWKAMQDPWEHTEPDADGNLVSPAMILNAYRQRAFPMADERRGAFSWFRPHVRAVITWDQWKVPESLVKTMRRSPYRLTIDAAFPQVIAACADRSSTWISEGIERLYTALHALGVAHSVEAWDAGGTLVGGCYGLQIGGCFCGESMFHRAPDASKIAVVHLVDHLRRQGFSLLDCQQQTPHMQRFGAREISDPDYARLLAACPDEVPWIHR